VRLLAPHMAAHGWEPTVLTVDPRDYEGRLDPALEASVPRDLRVIRARAWPAAISRRIGIGDLGLRAYRGLRQQASSLLARETFDAVFITVYPTYPALLGPALKRDYGVAFVLDYQDPWVGEWGRSVGPGAEGRPDLKSRVSRWIASRLEPGVIAAADGVTAVSHATYEQALARTPSARPRATAELPIGWDRRDLQFVPPTAHPFSDDGCVHVSYVGTLLPAGFGTLRALFAALVIGRSRRGVSTKLRLHFFGTSNLRSADVAPRVLPIADEYGLADVVSEHAPRLDYFEALAVLKASHAVVLLGSSERHYTPSKVFPAILVERPVLALMHEASNAATLLEQLGHAPSVQLVRYGTEGANSHVQEISAALAALAEAPRYERGTVDIAALEPTSACALAGRLAGLLDRCAA
jgi:hypothetical protein